MRELPQSIEAEAAILGSMLIYPESVTIVREEAIQADDFFSVPHQILFRNMLLLLEDGKPIDITTLTTGLIDNRALAQVGGSDYLLELTQNSATPANTRYYIATVQDKVQLRRLIAITQKIQEDAFDAAIDINEVLDNAEKNLLAVTRRRRTTDMKESRIVVNDVMKNIRFMNENHSSITGIATGFKVFDSMTNGLQKGDLIILAARPSAGKTAFALNLALNSSLPGVKTCALFSLEMPAEHLIQRMLAVRSKLSISNLRTGRIKSDNEWMSLDSAANDIRGAKLYIDDTGSITIPQLISKCRKLKTEKGLDLVVIDYIQLISGGKRVESRQQEVSEISRSLKQLARELEVPVIALSQLSRLVERREGNRPMLSDLRESGSIEQDADIVIFLSREDYQKKQDVGEDEDPNSEVDVIVAKHRNGATGDFKLIFTKTNNLFSNVDNRNAEGQR